MSAYPIQLTPDDNGTFLATSPDLPEVTTFGETRETALVAAEAAVEEALAARIADNREIPLWHDYVTVGKDYVFLSSLVAHKVSLYQIAKRDGVTRAELARRLDWHREQVDRLFRLNHGSKLDQFQAAFRALGYELGPNVTKAA